MRKRLFLGPSLPVARGLARRQLISQMIAVVRLTDKARAKENVAGSASTSTYLERQRCPFADAGAGRPPNVRYGSWRGVTHAPLHRTAGPFGTRLRNATAQPSFPSSERTNCATHRLRKNLNLHDAVERPPWRHSSSLTAAGSAGKPPSQASIIARILSSNATPAAAAAFGVGKVAASCAEET